MNKVVDAQLRLEQVMNARKGRSTQRNGEKQDEWRSRGRRRVGGRERGSGTGIKLPINTSRYDQQVAAGS